MAGNHNSAKGRIVECNGRRGPPACLACRARLSMAAFRSARAGMRREYVKWLRGDSIKEAIDIYYHIDPEDVRKSYMTHIPQLGI